MIVVVAEAINVRELGRYVERISDRWPLQRAMDTMATHQIGRLAGSLWDASEMGAPADVHCYTPAEFERKRQALAAVRHADESGIDMLASSS